MPELNVLGEALLPCCAGTGFQRDGLCSVIASD